MNNQQAVVEQIVNNLAFEVEAVPKYKTVQTASISKITPMNVKIRVRKKDETSQHNTLPIANETIRAPQKIRLVSSDQTIMAFDVFMEAEFEKKRKRKLRNHIFDILKPGLCLGPTDDDDYPYMPSSSYSAKIIEPSVTTKTDGALKQNFTLTKRTYQDYTMSTQVARQKWLFGKCKPGGCLDPPFSEEKYSYKPSTRSGHEQIVLEPNVPKVEKLCVEDIERDANVSDRTSEQREEEIISSDRDRKINDEDLKKSGRRSSIFDGGLFKKKRKSSDKSTNTRPLDIKTDETDSILNIYQIESTINSLSTHSISIITYPPTTSSDSRMSADKTVRSRGPSEDKSRKSFNDHSVPYFIPPKGVNRIKEKEPLHQRIYGKRRSSDVSDTHNTSNGSSKIPVPIPIPIPLPTFTNQRDFKATEVYDPPEKESFDKISPINTNTETPEIMLKVQLTPENIYVNPDEEGELLNVGLFEKNPESLSTNKTKTGDKIISDTNLQPCEAKESQQNNTQQHKEKIEMGPSQKPIPIPVPIPIPFDINKFNHSTTSNSEIADNGTETYDEKKRLQIKPSAQKFKKDDENLPEEITEDYTITTKSPEEIKSATLKPNSPFIEVRDKKTESILSNNLRTKIYSVDQDTPEKVIILSKVPIMEGDIMQHESIDDIKANESDKPTTQNYTKNKDRDNENIELLKNARNYLEEWSDEYKIPDTDIQKDKLIPNEVQNEDFLIISQFSPPQSQIENLKVMNDNHTPAAVIISDGTNRDINNLLSNNNDEIKETSFSETKNEIDLTSNKISPVHAIDENISESTKQVTKLSSMNNVYSFDDTSKFTNNGSLSFITTPVIIDKTKPQFEQIKEVYTLTNIFSEPKITEQIGHSDDVFEAQEASRFRKFDDDFETHSSISHELIGNKSVIYDFEELVPSTSSVKNSESTALPDKRVIVCVDSGKGSSENISKSPRTVNDARGSSDDLRNKLANKNNVKSTSLISSIPSTSTLKSALKKDTIYVELGFQSYINDKNEKILRTFGAANEPKRIPNDSVTVIKSQIRLSSNEIRIPVDSDHDMSIQIKKPNTNQRVSISESGFVNVIDTGRIIKQRTSVQTRDCEIRRPRDDEKGYEKMADSDIIDNNVVELYEQELIPLQSIIKNLRDEIDVLAAQQLIFIDKLYCPKKLPRLIHSNKKCFGCLRK